MPEAATALAPKRARALGPPPARAIVLGLAILTILVRLPAFLSSRHLVFDDGTYGVSVIDMRHGLAPYTGVFSAQGPLHFPLLYLGDLLGLRTIDGPRVTPMLAGVVATIAAWAIARRLAGPTAGLVAGVLVATSGSMIWTTGQVTGDGPAAGLAVAAVWAAIAYRDDPRLRRALLAGLLIGAALAVKPLDLPAALPIGWWLWSQRRVDHLASAVGASIAVWFASALPWGLGNVWRQSVTYNSAAPGPRYAKLSQLRKLLSTLGNRDLLVVGALALALATAIVGAATASRPAHSTEEPDDAGEAERPLPPLRRVGRADLIVVAVWAGVTALLLVFEPALYRNHLAAIVPPLAVLGALLTRTPKLLAVVLIVLVPWSAANLHDILLPDRATRARAAALMQSLHRLPGDAQVISDEPGFVYRAGLRTPAMMNDPSVKRIDQHLLTTASVGRAAADPKVCAVVVWSARFGRDLPGITRRARSRRARARRPLRRRALVVAEADPCVPLTRVDPRWSRTRPMPSSRRSTGTRSITALNDTISGRDRQQHQAEQHEVARTAPDVEHDREAEHGAEHVGAGVAEHQCSRRSSPSRPANAPITGAMAIPTGIAAARRARSGIHATQADLDRAARRPVEQVGEVRGERDEHRVGEQPAARDERHVGGEHERDRGAAEDLDRARRDASLGQRAQVAAKSAVALGAERDRRSGRAGRSPSTRTAPAAARGCGPARHRGRTRRASPGPPPPPAPRAPRAARPRSGAAGRGSCGVGARARRARSRPHITSSRTVSSPTTRPRTTITRARRSRAHVRHLTDPSLTSRSWTSPSFTGRSFPGRTRSPRTVTTINTGVITPSITPAIAMPESLSAVPSTMTTPRPINPAENCGMRSCRPRMRPGAR